MISSPPKPAKPKLATRRRLIDATARLFAEHGYNGLTMRSVAQEADANLAAANYHFGSKDALVLEMLSERIQPINKRRLALLEEAKRRNGKLAPSAHEIFHSLIFPIGEEIARSSKSRWSLAQLVARTFTEPVYFIERMHQKFFSQKKLITSSAFLAFFKVGIIVVPTPWPFIQTFRWNRTFSLITTTMRLDLSWFGGRTPHLAKRW